MAEVVRVIPDAQRDTAFHIWPTTTSKGRILTLPLGVSPSPRQRSAGRGLGRGAQTRWQTRAVAASRCDGLLSPALSSKGGEGGRVVGWWQCQDAPTRKCRLETGCEKCPNGAHGPQHATDLLIRTWQPGRDDSCAASSPLVIPTADTPPPGPGQNAQFTTTHWSVVLAAGGGGLACCPTSP